MLFSKKTPEEKMEKLVHRKAWGELSEYMFKDKEHKIALAQALGTSETEEAIDLLMELVESKDQDILEAACESLKKVGDDHNTTELLRILQTIPEENEPLRKKISETIQVYIREDNDFIGLCIC